MSGLTYMKHKRQLDVSVGGVVSSVIVVVVRWSDDGTVGLKLHRRWWTRGEVSVRQLSESGAGIAGPRQAAQSERVGGV